MKFLIVLLLAIIALTSARRIQVCYSTGDPHYRDFRGRRFNNQYKGTFQLSRTSYFTVHTKTGVWNKRASVNIATALKFGSLHIVVKNPRSSSVRINGKTVALRNGVRYFNTKIGRRTIRLQLYKSGSRLIFRYGREGLLVQTNYNRGWARYGQTQYQNVQVWGYGQNYGICGGKGIVQGKGIFKRITKIVKIKNHKCPRVFHAQAVKACKRVIKKTKSVGFKNCVFDKCFGLSARWSAVYRKFLKKWRNDIKKFNKYSKTSKKLADKYYKASLKALAAKRKHHRIAVQHQKNARKHLKNAKKHHRRHRHHKRQASKHAYIRRLHHIYGTINHNRAYEFYEFARVWKQLAKRAAAHIARCQKELKQNKKVFKSAAYRVKFFTRWAKYYKKVSQAHVKHIRHHTKMIRAHLSKSRKYRNLRNKAYKNYKNARKAYVRHAKLRNKHARWANYYNKKARQFQKIAERYIRAIKGRKKAINALVKLDKRLKSKIIKLTKGKKGASKRSRKCKTTPKYLDGIKFYSSASARSRALRRCKHRVRWVFYSCVFDHSVGLFNTKRQYDKIAKHLAHNNRRRTCYSVGDPHNVYFSGQRQNRYAARGWVRYFTQTVKRQRIEITNFEQHSRYWRGKAINRYIQVRASNKVYYLLYSYGRIAKYVVGSRRGWQFKNFGNNWNRLHRFDNFQVRSRYNHKLLTGKLGNLNVRFYWNKSGDGGYWNYIVSAGHGKLRGCSGLCCSGLRHGKKVKAKKSGNPYAVKFKNKCTRKTNAYRKCAFAYRRFRGNRVHAIKRCVSRRRHL